MVAKSRILEGANLVYFFKGGASIILRKDFSKGFISPLGLGLSFFLGLIARFASIGGCKTAIIVYFQFRASLIIMFGTKREDIPSAIR
jgi:hypothetical protein